jgi:TolA-binding protein
VKRRTSIVSATLLALAACLPAGEPPGLAELESRVAQAGLKAEPSDLTALSSAYEAASRPLEAATALERAIAAGSAVDQRRRLGRLWEAAGRFDAAALAYKAAGGPAALLDAAGLVADEIGDRNRAISEWVALSKAHPGTPEARQALIRLFSDWWPDEARAQREPAEDLALAQFPGEAALASAVGGAARRLAEAKQFDKALAAIKAMPDGGARIEAEAAVAQRQGRHGDAADLWERRWERTRDPGDLQRAAEAVESGDRPRAARLWVKLAIEHPGQRWIGDMLWRARGNDPAAIEAGAERLQAVWRASPPALALLALHRAAIGGNRAGFAAEALRRDPGVIHLDLMVEAARADQAVRQAYEARSGQDDLAGWACRLVVALVRDGESGAKAFGEALRDGGLLDEGTARRAIQIAYDRLEGRRDRPEAQAWIQTAVPIALAGPQHDGAREQLRRLVQELIKDKAARERLLAYPGEADPVGRAWKTKGHQALSTLSGGASPPLRLLAARSEAWRRAMDRRETAMDAAEVAKPLAADDQWAARWGMALVEAGDRADRSQFDDAIAALLRAAGSDGPHAATAIRCAAELQVRLGRHADALKNLAKLPADAQQWDRAARWTAAAAAAGASDRAMYERILDAAAKTDGDLVWSMLPDNRFRAPEAWRLPLVERAIAGIPEAKRRVDLLLWAARQRRDGGDATGAAATLAQARGIAGSDARMLEPVLLHELELASRRKDAAAEDAAAKALIAGSQAGIEDWRGLGEGLRRWLEPRLGSLPAAEAETALRAIIRTGNVSGLWAAGQLADRLRPRDPTGAAIVVQRAARLIWREDRDNVDRAIAFAQAEADAGRAGIAAGIFSSMAAWFRADRVGQERIDQMRRLAAAQLAKAGVAGAAIDDKDPKAALLRAAAQLAAGDEEEAWRLLRENRKLLDEHLARMPAELVLLAAKRSAGDGDIAGARSLVEALLRAQGDDAEGLARARLLLGEFAMREEDLPSATLEFQQVIATWPKSRAALEAQLRLGDCLAAARQLDQARKIYEQYTEHEDAETRIRAHARLAMLEIQAGNKPRALELFREIAAMNPPRGLADELYLDWGRALIGANRLQEAEDVLTLVGLAQGEDPVAPGEPLRITLRDTFLQTSQSRTAVPVVVRTASGDEEVVDMTLSVEAKGVFAARIPTALGAPVKGDRVLQVRGGDAITYDYTEDFKKGRRVIALGSGAIPIASDGQLKAASTLDGVRFAGDGEAKQQGLVNLGLGRADEEEAELARSQSRTYRTGAQLKPGNPIYLAVADPDRDTTAEADRIAVVLQSSAGDRVQAELVETGPHTGMFQGEVPTGLRPADLTVSDSAPGSNPAAMLVQPDSPDADRADRAWIAAGDRKAGKTVTVDLKQLATVDQLDWSRGRSAAQPDRRISAYRIEASSDGLSWSTLYDSSLKVALTGALRWTSTPAPQGVRSTRSVETQLSRLDLNPVRGARNREIAVAKTAAWDHAPAAEGGQLDHLAHGRIVIPAPGRYEFAVRGEGRCWVQVGGVMVVEKDRDEADPAGEPRWRGGLDLPYGQVSVRILSTSERGKAAGTLLWRRPGTEAFEPIPQAAIDAGASPKEIATLVGGDPATATAHADRHGAKIAFKPFQARFVRMVLDAWTDGDAPAIAQLTVSGGGKRLLPAPGIDYAALAANSILELSAGDEVTAAYRDEKNKRKVPEVLRARLAATYFNGRLDPLEVRTSAVDGRISEELFTRYRFRAGDVIAVRVTEYDADTTNQADRMPVRVTSSAGSVTLEAVETGKATGVFQAEVRTVAPGTANPPSGALVVKPGEQVQLSYADRENVTPGGPVERVALLREVVESAGSILVSPTSFGALPKAVPGQPAPQPQVVIGGPAAKAGVVLAPLPIQITDPDALVSQGSRVVVRVSTSRGAVQDLLLAPSGDPEAGTFAGTVALRLGSVAEGTMMVLPSEVRRGSAVPLEPGSAGQSPVIPVVGGDVITVTYLEGLPRGADRAAADAAAAKPGLPSAEARLTTVGTMAVTEDDFATPVGTLHVAGKLCVRVEDPDADTGDGRDQIEVEVVAGSGARVVLKAGETELHSGVFTASVPLALLQPAQPGQPPDAASADRLPVALGDSIRVTYREAGVSAPPTATIAVAKGHDAALSVFAKRFEDDQLAARTQIRLAESWFEIYKRQRQDLRGMERSRAPERDIAALKSAIAESLAEGTTLLQRAVGDDPDGAQADHVLFLLGNFEQESGAHDSAIDRYRSLLGRFPDSTRAPDAQFKIAQCFEEMKRFDDAWEAYVRLAYRWPEHELVADAMARIGLFYDDRGKAIAKSARDEWLKQNPGGDQTLAPLPTQAVAEFEQAAAVYGKLVERFPDHRIADQITLAQGNSLYQCRRWLDAQRVFDGFVLRFASSPALPKGLYWGASAALEAGDARGAFLRFGRLTQDFPDSPEAKFARGRLLTDKRLQGITLVDPKSDK